VVSFDDGKTDIVVPDFTKTIATDIKKPKLTHFELVEDTIFYGFENLTIAGAITGFAPEADVKLALSIRNKDDLTITDEWESKQWLTTLNSEGKFEAPIYWAKFFQGYIPGTDNIVDRIVAVLKVADSMLPKLSNQAGLPLSTFIDYEEQLTSAEGEIIGGYGGIKGSSAASKGDTEWICTATLDLGDVYYKVETEALKNTFKDGDKSQAVKNFQIGLLRRDFRIHPDGSYGANTEKAWNDYQEKKKNGEEIKVWTGKHIPRNLINEAIREEALKHKIPYETLAALIFKESSFMQFDKEGMPHIPPFVKGEDGSSATGLGQVTGKTATDYKFEYHKMAKDWRYSLARSIEIFKKGYDHDYNSFTDERAKAGRAYGMYHDGWNKYKGDETVDSKWELKYLEVYDEYKKGQ
jgi:hypothetical protein